MSGKHSLHDIEEAEKKPLWQQLGWLAMIWAGSVGALYIVGNRHLGYHSKLARLFRGVEQVAATPKFVILKARK